MYNKRLICTKIKIKNQSIYIKTNRTTFFRFLAEQWGMRLIGFTMCFFFSVLFIIIFSVIVCRNYHVDRTLQGSFSITYFFNLFEGNLWTDCENIIKLPYNMPFLIFLLYFEFEIRMRELIICQIMYWNRCYWCRDLIAFLPF